MCGGTLARNQAPCREREKARLLQCPLAHIGAFEMGLPDGQFCRRDWRCSAVFDCVTSQSARKPNPSTFVRLRATAERVRNGRTTDESEGRHR